MNNKREIFLQAISLICAAFLLIALAKLPIGYYLFLRIVVTIGAVIIVINEFKNEAVFWVIAFGLIAILFNPIIPVYLNEKSVWMPIDIIAALIFIVRAFSKQKKVKV